MLSPDSSVVVDPSPYSPMDISPIVPEARVVRALPPRQRKLEFVDEEEEESSSSSSEDKDTTLNKDTRQFLNTFHTKLQSKEEMIRDFAERRRAYVARYGPDAGGGNFKVDQMSELELKRTTFY
jgi:hypothetical protein